MFYLTGKQVKTKKDFGRWKQYMKYVASLVEVGDRVKCLRDRSLHGIYPGDTGTVVGPLWFGHGWNSVMVMREREREKERERVIETTYYDEIIIR